MDTSKEYIEMCRKAEEIQEQKPSTENEILTGIGIGRLMQTYDGNVFHIEIEGKEVVNEVWIPRRHQMDIMIYGIDVPNVQYFATMLCSGAFNNNEKSYDQFILKTYMYMKFSKTWNGKEWGKA